MWWFKKKENKQVQAPKIEPKLFHYESPTEELYSFNFVQPKPTIAYSENGIMDNIDGFGNFSQLATNGLYSSRNNLNPQQFNYLASRGFIGFQACALLAQHWLIDKVCTIPARDAIAKGYEIADNNPLIIKYDKQFKIRQHCIEAIKFCRVFGIRIIMFDVQSRDPLYYQKPYNPDGITENSYKGIIQIDPYWCNPEMDIENTSSPASQKFYNPEFWSVNGKKIHNSHLIIIRPNEVADMLKPNYQYAGVSIPQKIIERVYSAEKTANEAPLLALTKRTMVYKTDMQAAFANINEFNKKLQFITDTRNNFGVKAIDIEDDLSEMDTALADFDALVMTQYQLVSSIGEIPSTKLLGTSPKGFAASGEYEQMAYNELLTQIQENDLMPLLERHYELLSRSYFGNKLNIVITFNPNDELTAQEVIEQNLKKAQTDKIYMDVGAVDAVDVRNKITKDKLSGYDQLEPLHEEEIEKEGNEAI